ncbi:MAG: hypothetical protein J6B89_05065 [Bacilli bacterium]|nr:hypothetical protein [Bacilli bacterium]
MQNNKGFMRYEVLSILLFSLIFFSIVLSLVSQHSLNEKFHVMKYNALVFATNGVSYQYESALDTSYLVQLVDASLFKEIKNPFSGSKYCNQYESKIEIRNTKKYVTLQCGDYLISNQYVGDSKYKIYKVGRWKNKKPNGSVEIKKVYNYIDDGKIVFDDYYEKDLFVYMFNKKNETDYDTFEEINNDYELKSMTLYRKKRLVTLDASVVK